MERVGDHARLEDVVGRVRTPAVVDRVGVRVPVVANHRGDVRHLLGGRAVHVHVTARDQRELGSSEHALRRGELVRGTRPRRGRGALRVHPCGSAGHDHGVAPPARDRHRRFDDARNPRHRAADIGGPGAEPVDDGAALHARDHAVDVLRGQARFVEHAPHRLERDAVRVVTLEDTRLARIERPDDRDVVERTPRWHRPRILARRSHDRHVDAPAAMCCWRQRPRAGKLS